MYQTLRSQQHEQDIAKVRNDLSSCINKIKQVSQHLLTATKQDPDLKEALPKVTKFESPETLSQTLIKITLLRLAEFKEGTVGGDFAQQIPEELVDRMLKIM